MVSARPKVTERSPSTPTTNTVADDSFLVDHETVGEYSRQHFNSTITMHKVFTSQTTESGYSIMTPSSSIEPSSTDRPINEKFIILQNADGMQNKSTTIIRKRSITSDSEAPSSPNGEISSSRSDEDISSTSDQFSTSTSKRSPIDYSSYKDYDFETTKALEKDAIRLSVDCPKPIQVCSTLECKKSAQRMLALMDHSVDPCDDFYKYACGRGSTVKSSRLVEIFRTLPGYIVEFVKRNRFSI